MAIGKLVHRIARLPLAKFRLLLEAAFWLCVARTALKLVPFPRISKYLGGMQPPSQSIGQLNTEETRTARNIGQAVNAAAHHSPWEMVCLPRALAAWKMLDRRGIASRLHFGAPLIPEPGQPALQTHAWLSSAGVPVTGYPVARACVEVGYFARQVRRRSHSAHASASR